MIKIEEMEINGVGYELGCDAVENGPCDQKNDEGRSDAVGKTGGGEYQVTDV